ncbi:hypothetical protein FKM82_021070 [Ascaphus truei]
MLQINKTTQDSQQGCPLFLAALTSHQCPPCSTTTTLPCCSNGMEGKGDGQSGNPAYEGRASMSGLLCPVLASMYLGVTIRGFFYQDRWLVIPP